MHTYRIHYRPGEPNHCPGCGRSHWVVGRFSAECAFCATAIPFKADRREGFSHGWNAGAALRGSWLPAVVSNVVKIKRRVAA